MHSLKNTSGFSTLESTPERSQESRDAVLNPQAFDIRKDEVWKRHISRLKSSLSAHGHSTISEFLTQHTYLRGSQFSFKGHQYQKKILEDTCPNIVIIKSAQLGISEMSVRLALAKSVLVNGFSTIYTLPSASAAQNFMKTRVDPIIGSSPYLSELINTSVDNTAVKRFGDSYLYLKGAQVDTQAISVPADMVIMDEVDNSNQGVLTLFESRLIHSPYKITVKLSTPTIPNYGIDIAYKQSRRHLNLCKCNHCNHWFYPDYYEHVRIPEFTGHLDEITKMHFSNSSFRWLEAFVACPKCGLQADLSDENREWVLENPDDAFPSHGYRVSPFDCVEAVKPSDLVKSSVDYERRQDFYNQRLGIPMEDKETSLSEEELEKALISTYPGGGYSYVMGIDMGATCWLMVAAVMTDNNIIIVHTEGVPMHQIMERRRELAKLYRVRMTVVDSTPYTETVYRMQQEDANLFASVYVRSKVSVDLFKVKDQDEDRDKGINAVRQVMAARDRLFDLIMLMIRSGHILKVSDGNDHQWKKQLTDQKRVREFLDDELVFVWRKTQGDDHLHHTLLFTLIASRLLGLAANYTSLPLVLGKFKVAQEPQIRPR